MARDRHGSRRDLLIAMFKARCWAAGYDAPTSWTCWIFDLQVHKHAQDHGLTVHEAIGTIPIEAINDLADGVIRTTRENGI